MPPDVLNEFKSLKSGISVLTNTVGSILSCNILTPILRNEYAARKQKEILTKENKNPTLQSPAGVQIFKPVSMSAYQKLAYTKFSGSDVKI